MAEGNGELVDDVGVKSDDRADSERTEDYPKLIEYGLDKRVRTILHFFLSCWICTEKKKIFFFDVFRSLEN